MTFNNLLLTSANSILGDFLSRSLSVEGYEVVRCASLEAAQRNLAEANPHLIILNGIGQSPEWFANATEIAWPAPVIFLTVPSLVKVPPPHVCLPAPFAFQDLLLLVQETLYQRALAGKHPFRLPVALTEVETVLDQLREDLRARCIILSTSAGRLIKTAGMVEQGEAISLAALMSAGFAATARAAQLLGQGEMFDSSLQESEGYGLYAIRLQDKLILSVAFSARITIGLVRQRTAQAAIDILEKLARETRNNGFEGLGLDETFFQSINQALDNMLRD